MLTYSQWQRPLLALLALLLAAYSFSWAKQHPEYSWDGLIMMAAAAAMLAYALRRGRVAGSTPAATAKVEPRRLSARWGDVAPWRFWFAGGAVFLTLLLLNNLAGPPRDSYVPQFLMWLGAIVAYAVAIAPPHGVPRVDLRMWWDVNRRAALVVTLMVLAAFALRAWDLENIPAVVGGDEGSQGLEAIKILSGEIRNPFTTGWLGVPTMSFFYNSITIGPMGNTIPALRLPWAALGTATVLVFFWLVTRLHGVKLGLVAASLLAAYHFHIHFSRLGSNQIADPFFIALQMLFLYRGRDRQSVLDFVLAGVVVGVAQYFYAGARLTMIMLGVVLAHFIWLDRGYADKFQQSVRNAMIAAGAFLITAAPMLQYAVRFPNDYNARLNQVGIFQNGWVESQQAARGAGVVELLIEQGRQAFLMFNLYPDRTVWYGTPQPAMEGIWAVLFLLGLLFCTLRLLPPRIENRFFPFVVWWWSGMVLGGVLTESPPSYQRMVTLAPPAVYFVSYVLVRTVQIFRQALARRDHLFSPAVLVAAVLLLSALSLDWYFRDFTPMNRYGSRNGEVATSMSKLMLAEMEDNQHPVFLGPPTMYIGFGTIPYLEPRAAKGIDVHSPITEPPTNATLGVPPGAEPLFFVLPGRAHEIGYLEQAYPGGTRREILDSKGATLYWMYEP